MRWHVMYTDTQTMCHCVQAYSLDFGKYEAEWLYLIDLSFLGRYSFLSLLLKYLLSLLYVVVRGGSERVVELIIAFIHHVPVSVSLL